MSKMSAVVGYFENSLLFRGRKNNWPKVNKGLEELPYISDFITALGTPPH